MFLNLGKFFEGFPGAGVEGSGKTVPASFSAVPSIEEMMTRLSLQTVQGQERLELQRNLYIKLLQVRVFIPVPAEHQRPEVNQLITKVSEYRKVFVIGFTHESVMTGIGDEDYVFIEIPFQKLCEMTLQQGVDGMLLNIYSHASMLLENGDLKYFAEGEMPPMFHTLQALTPETPRLPKQFTLPDEPVPPACLTLDGPEWMNQEDFPVPEFSGAQLETILERIGQMMEQTALDQRYPLRMTMYQALLKSHVLLPILETGGAEPCRVLNLWMLPNRKHCIKVFATEEAARRHLSDGSELTIYACPFSWVCWLAMRHGVPQIYLNPDSLLESAFRLPELAYLAEGILPPPSDRPPHPDESQHDANERSEVADAESITLMMGQPVRPFPAMLKTKLSDALAGSPDIIETMYLFNVYGGLGEAQGAEDAASDMLPHLGVAVRLKAGAEWEAQFERKIWPRILGILADHVAHEAEAVRGAEYIDLFSLNEDPEMEGALREFAQPLFSS